jgi:flagellum-specific ATP synthase
MAGTVFDKYISAAVNTEPIKYVGHVSGVRGLLIESRGPQAEIGEVCTIYTHRGEITCEVTGLSGNVVQLMAYAETQGIETGDVVRASGAPLSVACSDALLGRVLGPLGTAIDGKGPVHADEMRPVTANVPPALSRPLITKRLVTGIRAVDGLLAVGQGQRLGIFAGSGVGKSTFQGMIALNTGRGEASSAASAADVNVIALIGERGREVNDFIENKLGEKGMERSVVVVATGDENALAQIRGAYVATTIAEYFRDRGKRVMFLFDNIARFARAQRQIGLARGEPTAQRGYPPSVFDTIQKLLERSGASDKGSITAFYAVLAEGDDMDDPITDTVRGVLDGHIILSRSLQARGHYPAIDISPSISRAADDVSDPEAKKAARIVRRYIADYESQEIFINAGAYKEGSNPDVDAAIAKHAEIEEFLCQGTEESSTLDDTLAAMGKIAGIEIP